jgi:hypothetical protein
MVWDGILRLFVVVVVVVFGRKMGKKKRPNLSRNFDFLLN